MAKPLSFDTIKNRFELRGYTLISTTCKNSKEKHSTSVHSILIKNYGFIITI